MLAFRPALNAPVLNVGFLPVGPARAAIVVFAEEWGGIGVSIGIRSNQGGQIAVFRNQLPIDPDVSIAVAFEPALAEAERMGFLFDEDIVASAPAGRGQGQATALWGRLMGEIEMPPARRAAIEGSRDPSAFPRSARAHVEQADDELPDFILDDLAEFAVPEIPLEPESEIPALLLEEKAPAGRLGAPAKPVALDLSQETEPLVLREPIIEEVIEPPAPAWDPPTPLPRPQLSKFRHLNEPSGPTERASRGASDPLDGASKLGRIPLVRVRRGRDGAKRVSYLARLLSSF